VPQQVHSFTYGQTALRFLLHLPAGPRFDERLPLIVYLHDMEHRGSDITLLLESGLPAIIEQQPDFPFIVVSPQLPDGLWWATVETAMLDALLDHVLASCPADERRVYLTGVGMGAYGAYAWAEASSGRFAALVPIAGSGDDTRAAELKALPVWIVHGGRDNLVLPREAVRMADALRASGNDVRFTLFERAGHDCWQNAYRSPALYTWLMKQQRGAVYG
jgi:predicted peptidase